MVGKIYTETGVYECNTYACNFLRKQRLLEGLGG